MRHSKLGMTKAVAVKGMAVHALQPTAHCDAPVVKAAFAKAPCGPPAKARGARLAGAKAAPKPRQTAAELENALADATGLQPKDVKLLLEALRIAAAKNLRTLGVFKLSNMLVIRLKQTPARPARKKSILDKEVVLHAKPAAEKITAVAVKPFYDAVSNVN